MVGNVGSKFTTLKAEYQSFLSGVPLASPHSPGLSVISSGESLSFPRPPIGMEMRLLPRQILSLKQPLPPIFQTDSPSGAMAETVTTSLTL
jgi:hypothetical protein